jgi:predicted Zn-dependent protease
MNLRSIIAVFVVGFLLACATSPLGRRQLNLFPESEMETMGATAFVQLKEQTPPSQDPKANNYVRCIVDAITREVGGDYANRQWEVVVFDSKQANAFALPGGKIGVYTGMLNVAENQHQIAAVIAHEVAHVLSRHANERASNQFATKTGLDLIQTLGGAPTTTKNGILAVLGVGAQVGILLPFDRAQEREADLLGLDLMASAGFNPQQSISLWQNMSKESRGAPPEFLSTHPSHQTRIQELEQRMPQAMPLYNQAVSRGKRPTCNIN